MKHTITRNAAVLAIACAIICPIIVHAGSGESKTPPTRTFKCEEHEKWARAVSHKIKNTRIAVTNIRAEMRDNEQYRHKALAAAGALGLMTLSLPWIIFRSFNNRNRPPMLPPQHDPPYQAPPESISLCGGIGWRSPG